MALDPQQQQFATFTNDAPKIVKMIDEGGIGALLDGAIEKIGAFGDALTAEVKGLGKAAIVKIGSLKLAGDPSSLPPLTPSSSPDSSEKGQGQQIEKSRVPELQIAMDKSGPSNLAQGLKCEHCNIQDSGLLASPYTPSLGANRSQSIGIG